MKLADFDTCEFCGDTPTAYFLSGHETKRVVICCSECAADVRRRTDAVGMVSEITKEEALAFEVMRI